MQADPSNFPNNLDFLKTLYVNGFEHWEMTLTCNQKNEDTELKENFDKIVTGKAYEIFEKNGVKVDDKNEMGKGAKSFKSLKECGCEILGRSDINKSRELFEKAVIAQILSNMPASTSIRITAFATGLLFGELVLLFKLINEFSINAINKNIEINCIDHVYDILDREKFSQQLETFNPETKLMAEEWKQDLQGAIPTFHSIVQKIVNLPSIKFLPSIKMRFFKSSEDYINTCINQSSYQHDFLIGADIGKTINLVESIEKNGTRKANAILLLRDEDKFGPYAYLRTFNSKSGKNEKMRVYPPRKRS